MGDYRDDIHHNDYNVLSRAIAVVVQNNNNNDEGGTEVHVSVVFGESWLHELDSHPMLSQIWDYFAMIHHYRHCYVNVVEERLELYHLLALSYHIHQCPQRGNGNGKVYPR
jgi:hypothetical protein